MTKPPPVPANRRSLEHTFLDDLLAQIKGYQLELKDRSPAQYPMYRRLLEKEGVGRILFDARQAEVFADLLAPSERISRQLKTPFGAFYLEFSEPVAVATEEWQVEDHEYLRAFLVGGSQKIKVWRPPAPGELSGSYRTVQPLHIAAFISDANERPRSFVDRLWRLDLETGETLVQRGVCEDLNERRYTTNNDDGVESRVIDPESDASTGLGHVEREDFFPAGFDPEGRVVGWWERATLAGSGLLQWCLAYMMAKSIVLEVRHPYMSRQVRRQMERKGIPFPKPWHVLTVDPRYRRTQESSQEPEPSSSHGYRYPVIGHVRVNRHRVGSRREDGTYEMRETLEYVPDHQRGLQHELFIPPTYAAQAGRRVPHELRGRQE